MKGLSIAGTAAMFLVGGGILVHGIPGLHHWIEALGQGLGSLAGVRGALEVAMVVLANAVVGIVAGALLLAVVSIARSAMRARKAGP
jgi:predicted DNA repair protein MutK